MFLVSKWRLFRVVRPLTALTALLHCSVTLTGSDRTPAAASSSLRSPASPRTLQCCVLFTESSGHNHEKDVTLFYLNTLKYWWHLDNWWCLTFFWIKSAWFYIVQCKPLETKRVIQIWIYSIFKISLMAFFDFLYYWQFLRRNMQIKQYNMRMTIGNLQY